MEHDTKTAYDRIDAKKADREMAFLALILVLLVYGLYVIPFLTELIYNH